VPERPRRRDQLPLRQPGRRLGRIVVAGAVSIVALGASLRVDAQEVDEVPAFDASAASDGVRLRLEIPGAPLTARLVDVGAPSVQAAATSIGTSRGFAALPDPGELVQSAPGLAVGLLNQGAAGLPPIALPTLPPYPLQVVSDINGDQHPRLGEGIYKLSADSIENRASSSATGGLQTGVAGNIAAVSSTADAGYRREDGTVVATATTDIQALTVGPLTIGRVTSTATVTLKDGTVAPSSTLSISALRIAGIDVAINGSGLQLASVPIPLPIGETLAGLLKGAGLDVKLTAAQKFDNAVIAPTLVISTKVDTGIGTEPGTLSITLGGATAALTGPSGGDELGSVDTDTDAGVDLSGSDGGIPSLGGAGELPDLGSPAVNSPTVSTVPVSNADLEPIGLFDIQSTYLALAGCAAGLYALGQLIRLLGVRWISIAG
jgi:hypothetical protein